MAKVDNPRKRFQFGISIPGLNPFLAQEVKIPDVEFDMVEHGDTGFLVKTAGLKKIGMLTINKIMPSDSTDKFMWDWMKQIFDTSVGGGDLPSNYKKHTMVEQYAPDGQTVIQRWEFAGTWPQKINGVEFSRHASENTVEVIELCVDEVLD